MSDESQAAVSESKRKQVSKRAYLADASTEADTIESAAGARYTLLDPAGNHDFNELFTNEKFKLMCAIFGFHTKVGNVANTVLNDKEEPGGPADAAAAIREFIAGACADPAVWAERSTGVGVRIDKDALAGAIVAVAESSGKVADYATIREKLEDAAYVRKARQVPAVATEYASRVGRATATVDDLLA